jgi:hypothetical protein
MDADKPKITGSCDSSGHCKWTSDDGHSGTYDKGSGNATVDGKDGFFNLDSGWSNFQDGAQSPCCAGGGGASGSWEEGDSDIVVKGVRPAPAVPDIRLPTNDNIRFGYPSEANAEHHINRHLTDLTPKQKNQLKRNIKNNIIRNFRQPAKRYIGFEVLNGQQYEFRAFRLPNGAINVGTIFPVDD